MGRLSASVVGPGCVRTPAAASVLFTLSCGLWPRSHLPPWTHLPTTLCRCLSQLKLCNKNTRDGWRAQTADINCSEFWNFGSQRSRHQQIQCLVTSYCLIYKLPVPTVSLYLEGDRGSLGLSYKSTNPIMQAPPPSPHHFPKAIISGVRTST